MNIDPELIQRYWTNQCSDQEKQEVERWLNGGEPDDVPLITSQEDENLIGEEIWSSVRQKMEQSVIADDATSTDSTKKQYFLIRRPRIWIGMAACFIVGLSLIFLAVWKNQLQEEVPEGVYTEVHVPNGKKAKLILPDSSMVFINAGSTLRYPKVFSLSERHVFLDGEAFFSVSKDKKRPFIVETNRTLTHVLGTKFNVRDFDEEKQSSITVEEGSVRFSRHDSSEALRLVAHDQVFSSSEGNIKSKVNRKDLENWRENVLQLRDISLSDAIPRIERWYGISIDLDDPALASLRVKGRFDNVSLPELLDDLCYVLNLQYKINQHHVLLYK